MEEQATPKHHFLPLFPLNISGVYIGKQVFWISHLTSLIQEQWNPPNTISNWHNHAGIISPNGSAFQLPTHTSGCFWLNCVTCPMSHRNYVIGMPHAQSSAFPPFGKWNCFKSLHLCSQKHIKINSKKPQDFYSLSSTVIEIWKHNLGRQIYFPPLPRHPCQITYVVHDFPAFRCKEWPFCPILTWFCSVVQQPCLHQQQQQAQEHNERVATSVVYSILRRYWRSNIK